jgi:gluconate 5-dehydrogenase
VNIAGCTWGAPVNFPRALAAEWGKYNIQVNVICPGCFPTKMSQGLLDNIEQKYLAQTPAARLANIVGSDESLNLGQP